MTETCDTGKRWLAGPDRLAALFLGLALPLGIVLAGIVPLGHVADEPLHLLRADGLLHGAVLGHRAPFTRSDGRTMIASGMLADPALLAVTTLPVQPRDPAPQTLTAAMVAQARAVRWSAAPVFFDLGPIAGYMPLFYLPAAAALAGAKLLGLAPFQAAIAARLANLACFAALGAAALALARRARLLLFCTLALPMTLTLAASASQDGLLIAATVLAAALLTRAWDGIAPSAVARAPGYWLAAGLIAVVATAKPPYLPLAALLLLPLGTPGERPAWPELRRRLAALGLVALPVLGWTALDLAFSATPRPLDPYQAGPLWPGPSPAWFDATDAMAQLHVLLATPRHFITLPARLLLQQPGIFLEAIGVLGWLSLKLPAALYGLWAAALAAAALADAVVPAAAARGAGPRGGAWPDRGGWLGPLLLLGAAGLAFLGICLSQYLLFTPVGFTFIGGPQGRYLLPLLPLLALAVPRRRLAGGVGLRRALGALPLAAAAADVLMLPWLIVDFYYLH